MTQSQLEEAAPLVVNDSARRVVDPAASVLTLFQFWSDGVPKLDDLVALFREHMWPYRRFSCCATQEGWGPRQENMHVPYHFVEESVPDEDAATCWVSKAACKPLDVDQPAWRVAILHVPLPARSAVVLRMHEKVCEGCDEGDAELAALEASLALQQRGGLPIKHTKCLEQDSKYSTGHRESTLPPQRDAQAAFPQKQKSKRTIEQKYAGSPLKRARSSSQANQESSQRQTGGDLEAADLDRQERGTRFRAASAELDPQMQDHVPFTKDVKDAIDAVWRLYMLAGNQKGGNVWSQAVCAQLDSQAREAVPVSVAVTAAIGAVQSLHAVNSNQKGGGGCALYHEHRVRLYSTILDLPLDLQKIIKERFEHMGKIFQPQMTRSYRITCCEIEHELEAYVEHVVG